MSSERRTPVWQLVLLFIPVAFIVVTAVVFIGGLVKVFVSGKETKGHVAAVVHGDGGSP
jgi:hypothetical protein